MQTITVENNRWQLSGNLVVDEVNAVLDESMRLPMQAGELIIDFQAVSSVDTAAIALMLALQRRAAEEKCTIAFHHVPDNLKSLAALYGVQNFFAIH